METFKERLLAERVKKNVSQTAVAETIGISWRAYQRYESGERWPTVPILLSLADYFEVSLDYLVGRTDNPEINR
ncbi:MAG: helix-turn-helix transcriptional regulator [Selenomonas sp.]|nr:helix-turn-helix transcriptional regulator [Selenomonas sp.]